MFTPFFICFYLFKPQSFAADRSGDGVTIDIDDSMTFIFNCGNADIGAVNTVVLEDNGSGQTAYVW